MPTPLERQPSAVDQYTCACLERAAKRRSESAAQCSIEQPSSDMEFPGGRQPKYRGLGVADPL